ncbi:MAG: Flp family type IVb pilin [Silicimonas sp.]|nr:Flp family type IVb pilin [Silicimonas sp.]
MRDLFIKFRKEESGASLVEYAVALIVVTIVGGAGVIVIGQDSGALATCAGQTTASAATAVSASNVAGGGLTC